MFGKIDTTEIIFSAALQERREVGADRRGEWELRSQTFRTLQNWTTHSLGRHSRAGSKGWYFVRYSDTRPFLLYFIFMIFFDRSYFHLEYLFWYFIFLISYILLISFILNTQTEDLSMSAELNTRVDFSQERWILSLPLLPSLIFLVLSLLSHPSCLCLLK